jgi:hypothetical protein
MPTSIYLDRETSHYISAFGIAAIVIEADRILVCHRPADIPHTVDVIWWLRAADAERVAQRARAIVSKLVSAPAAVPAAARDLAVGLTGHNDLLVRVKAATQAAKPSRHASVGNLKEFNAAYKARRLRAAAEGKTFMPYAAALRRLRGALATRAAARSGAVAAKAERASLIAQVFVET